jgi:hypothetical protein
MAKRLVRAKYKIKADPPTTASRCMALSSAPCVSSSVAS